MSWLEMGGYEFYVWSSYALFLLALAWDFLLPRLREQRAWRTVKRRIQRDAQRAAQRQPQDPEQAPGGQQISVESP